MIILYGAIRIIDGLILVMLWIAPLASLRVVRLHRVMLHRRICDTFRFLAFLLWLSALLSGFGLREPLIERVGAFLNANLVIGSLNLSLGRLLAFAVTVWASFLFLRFLRFLFGGRRLPSFSPRARHSPSDFHHGSLRDAAPRIFCRDGSAGSRS